MVNPNSIPRYAEPDIVDEYPETGACWNCGHMVDVCIGGCFYSLCVCKRDDGSCGEVAEVDTNTTDCVGWVSYE